jgi:hypothetical protein
LIDNGHIVETGTPHIYRENRWFPVKFFFPGNMGMSLEKPLGINMGSQFVSYRDITKRIKHLIWVKMGYHHQIATFMANMTIKQWILGFPI